MQKKNSRLIKTIAVFKKFVYGEKYDYTYARLISKSIISQPQLSKPSDTTKGILQYM
jgi:hypothetical protein